MVSITRRQLSRLLLAGSAASVAGLRLPAAWAAGKDSVTIGWPSDIPSWDPEQRMVPDAQSIYKMVFDQPLDQAASLELIPNLAKTWVLAPDGLSLALDLRDDVVFHNGDRFTADDFRYSFLERVKAGHKIDVATTWKKVADIEVASPTKVVMRFSTPMATAPQWLSFLSSFVVPKKYMESVGVDAFRDKPIGSGPYRVAEYQMGARIVLERFEQYWGPKPALRRVTLEMVKDPSARVAAIQSGQLDLIINAPVREVERLGKIPGLVGEINPITRVILLQCRNDLGFADDNIRLAAHHAIDKVALSKAFYSGAAVPLSTVATPGTPAFLPDFKFAYDLDLAKALLAKSGFGPDKPAKIKFAATNGQFPSDFDIARAIVAMWKKAGIDAELETIEYSKYFELNRGGKLPEATLYTWDNATGDPEIFGGFLLHPNKPFSAWKGGEVGDKVLSLENVVDYPTRIQGYKELDRLAIEKGATIPLLQSVQTVVRKRDLTYRKYGNGWVLAQTMAWS